jgi:hypothetical protein
MTSEQLVRATWHHNGSNTWILKERLRDGGAILATITERRYPANATPDSSRFYGYLWEVGSRFGVTPWRYQAMRRVRAALRDSI